MEVLFLTFLNLSRPLILLTSPEKTITRHLPSDCNTLCNWTGLQSQNRRTCALGNLIPTTMFLAKCCLLLAAEVIIES